MPIAFPHLRFVCRSFVVMVLSVSLSFGVAASPAVPGDLVDMVAPPVLVEWWNATFFGEGGASVIPLPDLFATTPFTLSTAAPLALGPLSDSGKSVFSGALADVRLFDVALSSGQIASLAFSLSQFSIPAVPIRVSAPILRVWTSME